MNKKKHRKKLEWLRILGPLGVAFLPDAVRILMLCKVRVISLDKTIKSIENQISSLISMSEAIHSLYTCIRDVLTKVSFVDNAVRFVQGDILEVNSDLNMYDALVDIQIAVVAAITEVKLLQTNAS